MKRTGWISLIAVFAFCSAFGYRSRATKGSDLFAELRIAPDGKMQIMIREDIWRGFFTINGYGGYAHNIYYWSTLVGSGPIYNNPRLIQNGDAQFTHRGTITVEVVNKTAVIELERIVSKPGETERLELSPANGTYRIKKINREPFITPE